MLKQTLSGSWKYKCQVFLHENSCDFGPLGQTGPRTLCFTFWSLILFPLSFSWFYISLSVMWHIGLVQLYVDTAVVMLCGSCWGQWLPGILWCNDPCHHFSAPSSHSRGEMGIWTCIRRNSSWKPHPDGAQLVIGQWLSQILYRKNYWWGEVYRLSSFSVPIAEVHLGKALSTQMLWRGCPVVSCKKWWLMCEYVSPYNREAKLNKGIHISFVSGQVCFMSV